MWERWQPRVVTRSALSAGQKAREELRSAILTGNSLDGEGLAVETPPRCLPHWKISVEVSVTSIQIKCWTLGRRRCSVLRPAHSVGLVNGSDIRHQNHPVWHLLIAALTLLYGVFGVSALFLPRLVENWPTCPWKTKSWLCFTFLKKILFIYLFLGKGEGRERERKRNINWWPLTRPQLGTRPATQACAWTGNRTSVTFW